MKNILLTSGLVLLAACGSSANFSGEVPSEINLLSGPDAVSGVQTPVDEALECVANFRNRSQDLRIGIADIVDGTGARTNGDSAAALLTQRPDMMFTVGMFRSGVRTINRSTTRVSEWELSQAMEMRLGEGRPVEHDGDTFDFRPVPAGTLLGTTHFVTGALTEVNWNTNSVATEAGILGLAAGARVFSINLAADVVVTDTRSTEIVFARSYEKTLVGREVSRGVFRFFDFTQGTDTRVELFDFSVTEQQNEPVHRAVRWLMELAAYDVAATLTRTSRRCDPLLTPPLSVESDVTDSETSTAPVVVGQAGSGADAPSVGGAGSTADPV